MYDDPDLNALEAQVDISNQTVAAAEARVREATAATAAARAALFPIVSGTGQAVRSSGASGGSNTGERSSGSTSAYGLALGASWELDLWGRIRRSIEAAGGTAQASDADLAGARLSVQAALATTISCCACRTRRSRSCATP